jgi:hypothetical protein
VAGFKEAWVMKPDLAISIIGKREDIFAFRE